MRVRDYLTEGKIDRKVMKNLYGVHNLKSLVGTLEGELFYAIQDANLDPEDDKLYNAYVDELLKEFEKLMKR